MEPWAKAGLLYYSCLVLWKRGPVGARTSCTDNPNTEMDGSRFQWHSIRSCWNLYAESQIISLYHTLRISTRLPFACETSANITDTYLAVVSCADCVAHIAVACCSVSRFLMLWMTDLTHGMISDVFLSVCLSVCFLHEYIVLHGFDSKPTLAFKGWNPLTQRDHPYFLAPTYPDMQTLTLRIGRIGGSRVSALLSSAGHFDRLLDSSVCYKS